MSTLAIVLTVMASAVFLGVIILAVLKQIAACQDQQEFDIAHEKSETEFDLARGGKEEKKEGFDFASKRQVHRKSFPGPWNRRR